MLYFHIIDVSEEIDINKTSASKDCEFSSVCNRCQDILKISINLSDIAIPFITQTKGLNYLYDFAKQNMNLIPFLFLIYHLQF